MSDVIKTIGVGGSEDYSTMTLWEADLDNGVIYAPGDVAIGKLTDAGDHTTVGVTINGGGTVKLSQIILMCEDGAYHSGIAGAGARVISSSIAVKIITVVTAVDFCICDFEITATVSRSQPLVVSASQSNRTLIIKRMLIHDAEVDTSGQGAITFASSSAAMCIATRNILYDISVRNQTGYVACGIVALYNVPTYITNNTVHHVYATTNHREAIGIKATGSNVVVKNNIVTDTSGDDAEIDFEAFSTTASHNLSSDSSATGTGSLTLKSAADQFSSITGGSEDLHLKEGADAIAAGTDLGTGNNLNIDIDGDNSSLAVAWDMGADQQQAILYVPATIVSPSTIAATTTSGQAADIVSLTAPQNTTTLGRVAETASLTTLDTPSARSRAVDLTSTTSIANSGLEPPLPRIHVDATVIRRVSVPVSVTTRVLQEVSVP